jgi:hypothetical protein
MSLLIIAWSLSRSDTYTRAQGQGAGSRIPGMITAKDATALEDSLAANPDNLSAREQLISYLERLNRSRGQAHAGALAVVCPLVYSAVSA